MNQGVHSPSQAPIQVIEFETSTKDSRTFRHHKDPASGRRRSSQLRSSVGSLGSASFDDDEGEFAHEEEGSKMGKFLFEKDVDVDDGLLKIRSNGSATDIDRLSQSYKSLGKSSTKGHNNTRKNNGASRKVRRSHSVAGAVGKEEIPILEKGHKSASCVAESPATNKQRSKSLRSKRSTKRQNSNGKISETSTSETLMKDSFSSNTTGQKPDVVVNKSRSRRSSLTSPSGRHTKETTHKVTSRAEKRASAKTTSYNKSTSRRRSSTGTGYCINLHDSHGSKGNNNILMSDSHCQRCILQDAWVCVCGWAMSNEMKHCGLCGCPQSWQCSDCQFAENECIYMFCGQCGSSRKTTESNNKQRNQKRHSSIRYLPPDKWACRCGSLHKHKMKFCGMCGGDKHWTCGGCSFDKNMTFFCYCSQCGQHDGKTNNSKSTTTLTSRRGSSSSGARHHQQQQQKRAGSMDRSKKENSRSRLGSAEPRSRRGSSVEKQS
ncbi:expressed unknown protein [Seminavis robusta]|uniref:Uncharacterized protein n=1 Tax=Seminavis robusta TaxID=568900 RepID=A0A9N8DC11_9STRA|nr:expressed unknown protein [Seminavis robusta]|eukprot:Sro24_g016640.1 n/a (490) ;mRNA; r:164236-165705